MECIAVAGGLDYDYFKWLTSSSNEYARRHINFSGEFGGSPWTNIMVEEMIRFLGCILKMSVDDCQLGGYCSYFTEYQHVEGNTQFYYNIILLGHDKCSAFDDSNK